MCEGVRLRMIWRVVWMVCTYKIQIFQFLQWNCDLSYFFWMNFIRMNEKERERIKCRNEIREWIILAIISFVHSMLRQSKRLRLIFIQDLNSFFFWISRISIKILRIKKNHGKSNGTKMKVHKCKWGDNKTSVRITQKQNVNKNTLKSCKR